MSEGFAKSVKGMVRSAHRSALLRRALNKLRRDPEAILGSRGDVIADLINGWGNTGWSASPGYLKACMRQALASRGPMLECGSGLTTLTVGVIAAHTGNTLYVIEHSREWFTRVQESLDALGIGSVSVIYAPLKDYGDYHWYEISHEMNRHRYAMVICDGPPGDTPGGRYGFMPLLGRCLTDGCVILLDDASREAEQETARRWCDEQNLDCQVAGDVDSPYFRLTLTQSTAARGTIESVGGS